MKAKVTQDGYIMLEAENGAENFVIKRIVEKGVYMQGSGHHYDSANGIEELRWTILMGILND